MTRPKKPAVIAVYLVYALALCLLFGLGAWQFQRGLEKQVLEALTGDTPEQVTVLEQHPGGLEDLHALAYRNLRAAGQLDINRVALLDNRVHQGRPGYEVHAPFALSGRRSRILVNLGWISRARAQHLDEVLAPLSARDAVQGRLYFPRTGFTLGETTPPAGQWPLVIQALDMPALKGVYGDGLLDAVIVAGSGGELVKIWKPYVVNSAQHFGYAVQWWGLTAVLAIFGVIWFRRSRAAVDKTTQTHD